MRRFTLPLTLALLSSSSLAAQDEQLEKRMTRLEELFEAYTLQQEEADLESASGPTTGGRGLAPSAARVYGAPPGISIGGYGEILYQNYAGNKTDTADALRVVTYLGYRFDENWVFNSELEVEHGSTGEEGETAMEFAYLDYAASDSLSVRGGLLLVPLGFLNELHEPPTYLAATRPETEQKIIPSTWREVGLGVTGDAGPWSYRAYALAGFDAEGFTADGLRGGRQKGSKSKAEDVAVALRLDWADTPGVLAGVGLYHGDAGQQTAGLGDTTTTIVEAHGEVKTGGLWVRALYALATVDDVEELNTFLGVGATESVGEELRGGYVELGYDVLQHFGRGDDASLSPFVRYEMLDTQADVPSGFTADPESDFDVVTVGLNWRPIDRVVIKLDYQDFEFSEDRVNFSMGYSF